MPSPPLVADTYYKGTIITLTATIVKNAAAADPTTGVFNLVAPDGVISQVTAAPTSTVGVWTAQVTANKAGVWAYQFVASGVVVGDAEYVFTVLASDF